MILKSKMYQNKINQQVSRDKILLRYEIELFNNDTLFLELDRMRHSEVFCPNLSGGMYAHYIVLIEEAIETCLKHIYIAVQNSISLNINCTFIVSQTTLSFIVAVVSQILPSITRQFR